MMMKSVRKIKLMPDYHCWPLWGVGEATNIDPTTLPLTPETVKRLELWALKYDSQLNMADPSSSPFMSEPECKEFDKVGRELQKTLQFELGRDYEVTYFYNYAKQKPKPDASFLKRVRKLFGSK